MPYIVFDLEATCWEKGTRPDRMEIIEIGAVRLPEPSGPLQDEFAQFVRPIHEPVLSDFCKRLTGIPQVDVDAAEPFPDVMSAFQRWVGPPPVTLCSWGAYDIRQLQTECARHEIAFPDAFRQHVNLKVAFADQHNRNPCGMKAALRQMEIPLDGRHHRGIDDARNIAKLAQTILPDLHAADGR